MGHGGSVAAQVDLWDTAGLERFESLSASYFTQAKAVIVCYSDDVESSVQALSQHILEATQLAQTALVFLCGNKADLHPPTTSPVTLATSPVTPTISPITPATSPANPSTPGPRKSWRPDFTTSTPPAANGTVENLLMEYDDLIEQRFEVSCKTGRGVEEMFAAIATALLLKADLKHDRARVLLGQPSISEEHKHKTKGKCC